jgi:hypothetical protein
MSFDVRRSIGILRMALPSLALGTCTLIKLSDESKAFYAPTVPVGQIDGRAASSGCPLPAGQHGHGAFR